MWNGLEISGYSNIWRKTNFVMRGRQIEIFFRGDLEKIDLLRWFNLNLNLQLIYRWSVPDVVIELIKLVHHQIKIMGYGGWRFNYSLPLEGFVCSVIHHHFLNCAQRGDRHIYIHMWRSPLYSILILHNCEECSCYEDPPCHVILDANSWLWVPFFWS